MTKLERLHDDLSVAEKKQDHESAKKIMNLIDLEKEKEKLRKWVWYR